MNSLVYFKVYLFYFIFPSVLTLIYVKRKVLKVTYQLHGKKELTQKDKIAEHDIGSTC